MMTLAEYIEMSITELFVEVAEMVNAGQVEVTPEELPGVPLLLFHAQTVMLATWREFVRARNRRCETPPPPPDGLG